MSSGSLAQWLQRLEGLHPSEIELGLERVSRVASRLGLLEPSCPVVTVAGTNGKGSTVAVLEALLAGEGRIAGVYTSPHFLRFNERIRVGGREATDGEIVSAFEQVEKARGDTSLTYFEFATLAALLIFRDRNCEVGVLEVGLGGRLDAVNILDADVAVITRVDLDHQQWLGDNRDDIGREKAGIARAGRPVVIADPDPPAALLAYLEEIGADPVLRIGREFSVRAADPGFWTATVSEGQGVARALGPRPIGALLPENIVAGLQAALLLGVEYGAEKIDRALAKASPPGRRQWREIGGRAVLLDVAHNPASVDKMLEYINATSCYGKRMAIFSAMKDKDLDGMVSRAAGRFDGWFLGDQPAVPRAETASRLAAMLREKGETMISVSKNLRQAYRRARSLMAEGDQLVVFGSFHTVAAVMPLLERETGA
jgi:dihydrofolate synthase/folylpolyglutamate synthase